MKLLADAHIPYLNGFAEQFGQVEYLPGNLFDKQNIRDKDALIVRTVTHFGKELLEGTKVKLICSATIGFDHIDTEYCDSHGIAWRTAPGCNASSVEQYVTSSLLHLARTHSFDLSRKTIGIIGVGNVGKKVEAACRKLGMHILLNDPPREAKEGSSAFTGLETIRREADIITLHTPLTKTGTYATYHLVDENFLNHAGKKPFIINSCRGAVADNRALVHALESGKIAGTVIDCWENEPDIDRDLLRLSDIATPHIAGYSADGKWAATRMSLENVNEFFHCGISPIQLSALPTPPDPEINLMDVPVEERLAVAVRLTYDPAKETQQLKAAPERFYYFRSHYPLRREYAAYEVVNVDEPTARLLHDFGFKVR
ncbi:MAG TPA: 4-phosphoerythronate dehydrogenase PdxB [Porphyromonadaceae bacterium]|nr:4-phosphoerythronate dehydrogenase PdxB [Porphyromonadaceae bacterium]